MTLQAPRELAGSEIRLRSHLPEDYPGLQTVFNDLPTMEHLHELFGTKTWSDAQIRDRFDKFRAEERLGVRAPFTVFWIKDGSIVGNVGLKNIDLKERSAEFGIILHRRVWGSGVAVECHILLLGHAFDALGLEKVLFLTKNDNVRMRGFFGKVGIAESGEARPGWVRFELRRDRWEDVKERLKGRLKREKS